MILLTKTYIYISRSKFVCQILCFPLNMSVGKLDKKLNIICTYVVLTIFAHSKARWQW